MRLLLDTHTFVWWSTASPELGAGTIDRIAMADEVYVSLASLWEIVLKEATPHPILGTDDAFGWFAEAVSLSAFAALAIEARHLGRVQNLPLHHRDPFDRLLIAQSQLEHLVLVTRDDQIRLYDVDVTW